MIGKEVSHGKKLQERTVVSEHAKGVSALRFSQPTTQPTKCDVLVPQLLAVSVLMQVVENDKLVTLHGRGRGFESRRPRHFCSTLTRKWQNILVEAQKGHAWALPVPARLDRTTHAPTKHPHHSGSDRVEERARWRPEAYLNEQFGQQIPVAVGVRRTSCDKFISSRDFSRQTTCYEHLPATRILLEQLNAPLKSTAFLCLK